MKRYLMISISLLMLVACAPVPTSTPLPLVTADVIPSPVPSATITATPIPSATPEKTCALGIGDKETVMSYLARNRANLHGWPDISMGVIRTGDAYTFIASNGTKPSKTVGSLEKPTALSVVPEVPIQNLKDKYDYAAGGPVYKDPQSGMLLMVYHSEKWENGNWRLFFSTLGLAKSMDDGNSWVDLGEIVTPEIKFGDRPHEITDGPIIVVGEYFYLYFRDSLISGQTINLAVARARISDVVQAAKDANSVVPWTKYFNASWSEPGIGGRSSPLEAGNLPTRWFDASYNDYLGKYIMVVAANRGTNSVALYLMESKDGLAWGTRRLLEDGAGENFYPTIVGLSDSQRTSNAQFYIYYTISIANMTGGGRWDDAVLVRRRISCELGLPTPTTLGMASTTSRAEGSWTFKGNLKDASGFPIAKAPIELSLKALEGSSMFFKATASGIVPSNAVQALVGFRINTEGPLPGARDFKLYEIKYQEGSQGTQLVQNGNFSQGLQGWISLPSDTARLAVERSDRGDGQMLTVSASPEQKATVNSRGFPVMPNSVYTATFTGQLSRIESSHGYFTVIFNSRTGGGGEITRTITPLEPDEMSYNTQTNENGDFQVEVSGIIFSKFFLTAQYFGDNKHSFAISSTTVSR